MDNSPLTCVLFDLDGTLVDSAPDLIACLNSALSEHGFQTVTAAQVQAHISFGAAAMIKHSSAAHAVDKHAVILDTMLWHYENNIMRYGGLFSGIAEVLMWIENKGLKWGVVTNKRERFTLPLMDVLKLTDRAACIISGDTTSDSKPHPAPMFEACKRAAVKPEQCVFIGDALHDITAGKNAAMQTLAATYGYLTANDCPAQWGADGLISTPKDIPAWLEKFLCY